MERMSEATGTTPLNEVRAWLREHIRGGVICPACEQTAKVYRRRLHAGNAVFLIRAVLVHGTDWFHAPTFINEQQTVRLLSLEYSMLKFWGFLEKRPGERDDGGSAGWWRVTLAGQDFARGISTAPRHVFVYNDRLQGVADEQVSIQDALGTRFNYNELMAA